jgi:hypothetical protein
MNWKNRQHLLVIVAGAAVALLLTDRLVFSPVVKSWKARAARIAELSKKVADGRALVDRERSLRGRWDYMTRNMLSTNRSAAEQQVLQALDRWAQENRLNLLSVSPQWKQEADDYRTLECRLEAAGNLGAITRFLYEIEKDPLALRVQTVEIGSRDNDGQQIALGLQISGLVLEPTPAGSPVSSTR